MGYGLKKATSTELTGGEGFTYEDTVVAYYLTALLREEHAALQRGVVKSVAVQQSGHDRPMDDMIVEFDDQGVVANLDLQIKKSVAITSGNSPFQDVIARSVETRNAEGFRVDRDAYGFAVENVAKQGFQALKRLIEWAKASPDANHFARRFQEGGAAAKKEREVRSDLKSLINAKDEDEEWSFYRHLVGDRFEGLREGGLLRAEIVNRLQDLVESNDDGKELLLFDRLCRLVRDGAGTAQKWTRDSLLAQLRGVVRLKVTPNYQDDLKLIEQFSIDGIANIVDDIDGFRVERPNLQSQVRTKLNAHRLVNLSGLPGCGKSVVLRQMAIKAKSRGPILFIKSDRLSGKSWLEFATTLGLRHRRVEELLAEIGSTGSSVLYIDGIDRINPDQKKIILDILHAIEATPSLSEWRVLATSRDQGIETYRSWFPASFYKGSAIGEVQIGPFDDDEAKVLAKEKPGLRHLLLGAPAVRDIARRPFFAAVLAKSFSDAVDEPQTETDLINAWWARAGHDTDPGEAPIRQRALLDIAEKGVSNLGKNVSARKLAPTTFTHIGALQRDLILRPHDAGAAYSFTHDIFFEWVFFRLLIELGDDWIQGLADAGEPPLLGRVIGLLAQHSLSTPGKWTTGYHALNASSLRPQWKREWLTAPPFTSAFGNGQGEFGKLLIADGFVLLEKVLVWFQAHHTVPNANVLMRASDGNEGADRIRLAEMMSWPSDFAGWRRFLDWLISLAPQMPVRLMPVALEVFSVWQNALADLPNHRSQSIVEICSNWLIDLEGEVFQDPMTFEHGKWDELGSKAREQFASSLRFIIMRASRCYPMLMNDLLDRAIANQSMRGEAYSDLMTLAWIAAEVSPHKLAEVAKAEILEELPQDRLIRLQKLEDERYERLRRIREKPQNERTVDEEASLDYFHLPIGSDMGLEDNIGVDSHHQYYFPTSAMHEPFASLFAQKPEAALQLVRDISNHAVTGWRQCRTLSRRRQGTPIPISIDFPWGQQSFWGDWPVYSWHLGELTAQPLECAFLSLTYWALKQVESGRAVDEVIHQVVEGNESVAAAGLGLTLALEKLHVSEVTLSLLTGQRLWLYDMHRARQEPMRKVDVFGLGVFQRLTGEKGIAEQYLEKRAGRFRDVRRLAMSFAISTDTVLRNRFKEVIKEFPSKLPYEYEEHRANQSITADLTASANEFAELGVPENYRAYQMPDDQVVVAYEPPLTPEAIQRGADAQAFLHQQEILAWAMSSLRENALQPKHNLAEVMRLARTLDSRSLFVERHDAENHTPQSVVAAVAACVICFGDKQNDQSWAIKVLARVEKMREPEGAFHGSKIGWHPALQLIYSLLHLRRTERAELAPARRLIHLTAHPHEDSARFALAALLADPEPRISWSAAQLAFDLALYHPPKMMKGGGRDNRANQKAAEAARRHAEKSLLLQQPQPYSFAPVAQAGKLFDTQLAQNQLRQFPVEQWCESPSIQPLFLSLLLEIVKWTSSRLSPSRDSDGQRKRPIDMIGWCSALGDVIARAAPFLDTNLVINELLTPFLAGADALEVIAVFADRTVTRHVLDAHSIPSGTFELLAICVNRVVGDTTFSRSGYRSGEVLGHHLPQLIDALLVISVEHAKGAARYVNGDWSDIRLIMPMVTSLVTDTGWSAYVMSKFLLLCERAGIAYPIDDFIIQATAILTKIERSKGSWVGTSLPARTAATVQRLAEANYPLRSDQAQGLLRVLDALIDLGDRRSSALAQTEAFKGVQIAMPER